MYIYSRSKGYEVSAGRIGKLVKNYTYSHIQLTKRNREKEVQEELVKINEVIEEITGVEVE